LMEVKFFWLGHGMCSITFSNDPNAFSSNLDVQRQPTPMYPRA